MDYKTLLIGLVSVVLAILAIFLVIIILLQRGKGGGLAGAFGGMGGQSAFGTKAGDLFTRITAVAALLWIFLCVVSVKLYGTMESGITAGATTTQSTSDTGSGGTGTPDANPTGTPAEAPESDGSGK
jgi:preprotein translocase subunit SecG